MLGTLVATAQVRNQGSFSQAIASVLLAEQSCLQYRLAADHETAALPDPGMDVSGRAILRCVQK